MGHQIRIRSRSSNFNAPAWQLELGASAGAAAKTVFKVWAPRCTQVHLKFIGGGRPPLKMERDEQGYFSIEASGVRAGARYVYTLDGNQDRPDPVSRFQPGGVHGPSEVVDQTQFKWSDGNWRGLDLKDFILYEAHVGTFTKEGTFWAAIKKIPYLKQLGVTCLELMPVAQFPGARNWGYDGVGLYAVQNSYGGPERLKELVNACHRSGLAVCLDVVYNHLGPEGNYLREFGPYFTDRHHTLWGAAVNYDDRGSDEVRRFIVDNALYWVIEYHIDALRLDAVHSIYDFSAKHILEEVNDRVQEQAGALGRKAVVIAESDLNDSKLIRPKSQGGYELAAQWSDDYHHALHAVLTGERNGYYQDFGSLSSVAKALQNGFVYDGIYSQFRQRKHGNNASDLPGERFVVSIQNHDQVGNRPRGDRFGSLISFQARKVAAACLLLSPYIPLLFMGEEYGEVAPFQYFIDHSDPDLVGAVREGRIREFAAFGWEDIADPKNPKTFRKSKLSWPSAKRSPEREHLLFYRDLIVLRKKFGPLKRLMRPDMDVAANDGAGWLAFQYTKGKGDSIGILASFSKRTLRLKIPFGRKIFTEHLNSEDRRYGGTLPGPRRWGSGERVLLAPFSVIAGTLKR